MRYDLVQGDLEPPLLIPLTGYTGTLMGTSIELVMKQAGGAGLEIVGPCVVADPVKLIVQYDLRPGDTDVPGVYRARVRVLFPGGLPMSFPSDDPLYVVIHAA
jgi:hypothetical protein